MTMERVSLYQRPPLPPLGPQYLNFHPPLPVIQLNDGGVRDLMGDNAPLLEPVRKSFPYVGRTLQLPHISSNQRGVPGRDPLAEGHFSLTGGVPQRRLTGGMHM